MNPIKDLRTRYGLTQSQLAQQTNLTILTILRHEQGLPHTPSDKLASYFSVDLPLFTSNYRQWQTYKRIQSGNHLAHDIGYIKTLPSPVGSFKYFREHVLGIDSQVSFCVLFCVHQSILNNYERGISKKMPYQLRLALDESGIMSAEAIEQLDDIGTENYEGGKRTAKAS